MDYGMVRYTLLWGGCIETSFQAVEMVYISLRAGSNHQPMTE